MTARVGRASIVGVPLLPHPRRALRCAVAIGVLAACLATTTAAAAQGGATRSRASLGASAATTHVLLALGDSLAAGYQPTDGTAPPPVDPATGYRDQGYPHSYPADVAHLLGLGLVDLACPGETTASMTSIPPEPACGATYRAEFGSTSQLAAARAYISHHRGLVSVVTLDIGANDVDGCLSTTNVDLTCLAHARTAVSVELPRILASLRATLAVDDPRARVVAMNYYDPFLAVAYHPGGLKGDTEAALSVMLADGFNALLSDVYHHAGVPVADVAGAFHTGQVTPALRYAGRSLPADVAYVCHWTWMCPVTGSAHAADIHPDDAGYSVIARTFARLLEAHP